ncbi:MAG: cytochrome-c oxidase, cbb3-type subunit III [Steroidobacteraceae bacterium]|jgi:cytochrome c oxidase cbb3-type subunit 3
MSSGFSTFIVALTALNIAAAVWLLVWMRKKRGESQITTDTTGHVWDGDLREYNNPLPRWWLWLFVLTVIFALGYLALYPGLGNAKGSLGWSSKSQFDAMQAEQEKKTQAMLAQFAGKTPVELMQDPRAITVGRNLFANNCAACHGSDGRGAPGFPNITDADWLWGGEPETIEATIREGRNGIMTPWIDVIGPKGVDDVVAYVMSLSGRQANGGDAAAGKTQFEAICAACHGVDGKGNHALGAPNLTDNVWLHGGSQATIRETVTKGRNGVMPAHGDRMGEARVKLLTAYVLSMGEQRVAQAGP